jgi:transposase
VDANGNGLRLHARYGQNGWAIVVGRRNWLFADTVGGASASANLYSLIETCKAHRIDPYTYLIDLCRKLPLAKTAEDFEALLPWSLTPASP